ncbi:hypothetical protein N7535_004500 [Penicillium sp. DV-2018c]|nr:hypothetical protein N7461_008083 [Penicillium sp. DV-2018c]KAJ5570840.1 hypothetical protein N7535_004500 [Penicillium sp. DV-2018c]
MSTDLQGTASAGVSSMTHHDQPFQSTCPFIVRMMQSALTADGIGPPRGIVAGPRVCGSEPCAPVPE